MNELDLNRAKVEAVWLKKEKLNPILQREFFALMEEVSKRELGRRAEIYTYLEDICRDLDLRKKQHTKARKEYTDVTAWLLGWKYTGICGLERNN